MFNLLSFRPFVAPVFGVCLAVGAGSLAGCGSGIADRLLTSVAPLASEDLAGPCTYELTMPDAAVPQRAVLVVFERGDSAAIYNDAQVRQAALDLHYAMVFAHECDAKSQPIFQSDAAAGPARALFAALDEFATVTGHTELSTDKVVLYGFSAAGALTATMANDRPDRVLGTIQYADGSAFVDMGTLAVSAGAARLPALVLANANDNVVGTSKPMAFYLRGRALGAPWAFAVQGGVGHCCTASTRDLVVPWMRATAVGDGLSAQALGANGENANFVCSSNKVIDPFGNANCQFSSESVTASAATAASGWLPDAATATAWLAWVR